METALIGCIRFLDAESLSANLLRLARIPISLPNPLVSCYARVYLCRVAMRLTPNDRAPHWRCFNDWINTIPIQPVPIFWSEDEIYSLASESAWEHCNTDAIDNMEAVFFSENFLKTSILSSVSVSYFSCTIPKIKSLGLFYCHSFYLILEE